MERIDFIETYCDRWCERCPFTMRCGGPEGPPYNRGGPEGPPYNGTQRLITMSYTVDIISGAIPESYDEALFVRDALADVYDSQFGPDKPELFEPPSSEMTELHRRLTARYPCITESTDGPWSDGPLINNFGQRSATLGISYSRVEDVLPFLIATATDMGFWVLDAQDDRVHLPGGGTLRPRDSKTPSRARKAWWRVWK